jgi:hypothetical protein
MRCGHKFKHNEEILVKWDYLCLKNLEEDIREKKESVLEEGIEG